MPNKFIYVLENGSPDLSRWLHMSLRPEGACMLHLSDLCHPGRLSALTNVPCELSALKDAVERGALQITLPKGYLLLRRDEDVVHLEFRSEEDAGTVRVTLSAADVQARVNDLLEETRPVVTA